MRGGAELQHRRQELNEVVQTILQRSRQDEIAANSACVPFRTQQLSSCLAARPASATTAVTYRLNLKRVEDLMQALQLTVPSAAPDLAAAAAAAAAAVATAQHLGQHALRLCDGAAADALQALCCCQQLSCFGQINNCGGEPAGKAQASNVGGMRATVTQMRSMCRAAAA